jgi:predicted small metal-binding protein
MRAADCDTPGCTYRMQGKDDEDLLRSIRRHVDSAHPQDEYTDEELRDWMGSAAYTITKP